MQTWTRLLEIPYCCQQPFDLPLKSALQGSQLIVVWLIAHISGLVNQCQLYVFDIMMSSYEYRLASLIITMKPPFRSPWTLIGGNFLSWAMFLPWILFGNSNLHLLFANYLVPITHICTCNCSCNLTFFSPLGFMIHVDSKVERTMRFRLCYT